jgi:hypothetical protein
MKTINTSQPSKPKNSTHAPFCTDVVTSRSSFRSAKGSETDFEPIPEIDA